MSTSSSNGSHAAGNGDERVEYDALVVGSGIGGMESALKLGAMGYRVLVVEKEPSVGGKMILLSKVFPTLDCASCISTPKMGETTHHPNLTVLTDAEVAGIGRGDDGRFSVRVQQKPRFVDTALCTGCRLCETRLHGRRCPTSTTASSSPAARRTSRSRRPFPRRRSSSGPGRRPARSRARPGSRRTATSRSARSGEYEKAFQLVLETTPLVGSLGRACYAPCEDAVHARRARGLAADPPDQALPRRPHYARGGPGVEAGGESGKRRDRRLRAGRPDRRLAARAARPPREDLRGCARARRSDAPLDPELPPAGRGGRAGRRERHRARGRDRDERAASTTSGL